MSSHQQVIEGSSLEDQAATLRAYCAAHGLEIVEELEDAGLSGTLASRPGLQRLRELARTGAVEAVVCCKVDRLSRKAWLGEQVIEELEARGIRVLFH